MNEPHDILSRETDRFKRPPLRAYDQTADDIAAADMVEDYLDHQMAPLIGLIPLEERRRIRRDLADYLANDVNELAEEGRSRLDCVRSVIAEYGDTRAAADEILDHWLHQKDGNGRLSRRFGVPKIYAAIYFGVATSVVGILAQIHISAVNSQSNPLPVGFGLSPAQLRTFIPSSLPLPESSPTFGTLIAALFALPITAGVLTGWTAIVHPARACYHVMLIMIMFSFASGVLMLPACYGLMIAVLQMLYWLPVGCLFAHIGGIARRYYACRYRETP